jgi:copper chaperone CopZ
LTYYVHNVPGRLRVRIPAVKNNPGKERDVQAVLGGVDGIESISVNTMTGSVVVKYDSKSLDSQQILKTLEDRNYFDEARAVTNDQYIEGAVSKAGQALGKAVLSWAVGKAFEASGLSFLAVFI